MLIFLKELPRILKPFSCIIGFATFFFYGLVLSGCSQDNLHVTEIRETIQSVGPETVIDEARALMLLFTNDTRRPHFLRVSLETNILNAFGNSAKVGADRVSITSDGLGSYRAGILIFSTDGMLAATNYTMLYPNIYYWSERR